MALNCWSKLRRGTTSAETIPEVQDVQDCLNTTDVGTLSRITRHHHPPTGYLQAGQFHSAVRIQQLRLLIMKIIKLRQERSMTRKAGIVEHKSKVRKLVRTQLQLKIVLKLHFIRWFNRSGGNGFQISHHAPEWRIEEKVEVIQTQLEKSKLELKLRKS